MGVSHRSREQRVGGRVVAQRHTGDIVNRHRGHGAEQDENGSDRRMRRVWAIARSVLSPRAGTAAGAIGGRTRRRVRLVPGRAGTLRGYGSTHRGGAYARARARATPAARGTNRGGARCSFNWNRCPCVHREDNRCARYERRERFAMDENRNADETDWETLAADARAGWAQRRRC